MAQTFNGEDQKDWMELSIGPHHPATHGVLRVVLKLEGETIMEAQPEIGFLHTAIEKSAEYLNWQQANTVIDRADYLDPVGNNVGFCLAVEKLMGITDQIPARATMIRVIMLELQRIASHMVFFGTGALDLGSITPFFWCFDLREQILDILEEVTGQRMNPSYSRVGGVNADLTDEFFPMVEKFLKETPQKLKEMRDVVLGNPIFVDRTRGIGKLTTAKAIEWGLTGGHLLRTTGSDYDVRKYYPYCGYENFDFKVPVYQNGDLWDRFAIRLDECDESLKIIRQAVDNMPDGMHVIDDRKIQYPPKEEVRQNIEALIHHFKVVQQAFNVPQGEVYHAIESPRGELGFYIISDGTNHAQRVRFRPPSFYGVMALETLLKGHFVADMVGVIAGVDPVFGEVDR